MKAHAPSTTTSVAAQVAGLPHLSMDDLWKLWDEHFDERPGHHHRGWLESRLAYRIQERAFGGLKPSLRKKLEDVGQTGILPKQLRGDSQRLLPGTSSRASTTMSSIACWCAARVISSIRGNASRACPRLRAASPAATGRARCSSA